MRHDCHHKSRGDHSTVRNYLETKYRQDAAIGTLVPHRNGVVRVTVSTVEIENEEESSLLKSNHLLSFISERDVLEAIDLQSYASASQQSATVTRTELIRHNVPVQNVLVEEIAVISTMHPRAITYTRLHCLLQ